MISELPEQFKTAGIKPEEDKQKHGKSPQGRPSVAKKGQWNTDDRQQTDGHSDVDQEMGKKDGNKAIAKYPAEGGTLPFFQHDHS